MISILALAIVAALLAWNSFLDFKKFRLELEFDRF
ncbi:hypothetical protein B840_07075 [Corynebacterium marinum DSM 44953]|uniref:Uncharacterized protein n=1 Tax=Corynebacterium marinum DSM 44953 TaxID=1224162 RepID=A0A0B6TTV1_9CORY|nr:hypothetical protein B840_07075 [Corynebacterium marinum DSM 44953]